DPNRRDVPYAPVVQAFRVLVQQILAGNEDSVAQWRERFSQALGSNAQLITGRPPPVPTVGALEAKNRFRATLHQFLGVFPRKERPVALFLDDLQWAD